MASASGTVVFGSYNAGEGPIKRANEVASTQDPASPWALIETRVPSGWCVAPATACAVWAVLPGPWLWRAWCISLAWALLSVG